MWEEERKKEKREIAEGEQRDEKTMVGVFAARSRCFGPECKICGSGSNDENAPSSFPSFRSSFLDRPVKRDITFWFFRRGRFDISLISYPFKSTCIFIVSQKEKSESNGLLAIRDYAYDMSQVEKSSVHHSVASLANYIKVPTSKWQMQLSRDRSA